MTIEETVYSRCTSFAGISSLISARCYPDRLPEDVTYPALTYNRVSSVNSDFRDMDANTVTGLTRMRFQFNCYGSTSTSAKALADQIQIAWDSYKSGCTIGHAFIENRISSREDEINAYREIVDVTILTNL